MSENSQQTTLAEALHPAKIYLVGGAVRDQLLGYPYSEQDWVVVGSTPQAMLSNGFQQVGKDFPVFLHPSTKEEYALARTERKSGKGYHGFACYAAPEVSLEQDLERRDLTINAMAKAENGELTDPYGGQQDLQTKTLRHVSPAFEEDPLRVLRSARFAARYAHLGFRIADETLALMQKISASGELTALAPERIFAETEKGLSEASPSVYIDTLLKCKALAAIAPTWADALNTEILSKLEQAAEYSLEASERFALLCLKLSSTDISDLGSAIRLPNHWQKAATNLITGIEKLRLIDAASEQQAAALASHYFALLKALDSSRKPEQLTQFIRLATAAGENQNQLRQLKKAADALNSVQAKDLIAEGFSGAELGKALGTRQRLAIEHSLS